MIRMHIVRLIPIVAVVASCTANHKASPSGGEAASNELPVGSCAPPSPPQYRVLPFDLTTSTVVEDLDVVIDYHGLEAPEDVVEELAQAVSLFSWPGMHAVPFSLKRYVRVGSHLETALKVLPSAPLDGGWYGIGVKARITKSSPILGMAAEVSGMYVSRFKTTPGFLIRSVTEAAEQDGTTLLYLEFSERTRVGDVPAASLYLRSSGGILGCSEPDWRPHADALRVQVVCPRDVDLGAGPYEIVILSGIKNEGGLELTAQTIGMNSLRVERGFSLQTSIDAGASGSAVRQSGGASRVTKVEPESWL